MDFAELEKLLARADRFRKRLHIKEGSGTEWSFTIENGESHFISIDGVKPPEEVEDEIESMFIWLWSLKDYTIKYVCSRGKSKNWVESKINIDPDLCICADIANSLKHGGLDPKFKPRSNKNPKLGALKYRIPHNAAGAITFGALDVNLKVKDASLVCLEMPVIGTKDKVLGDAFKYLDYALKAWEGIVDEAGSAV